MDEEDELDDWKETRGRKPSAYPMFLKKFRATKGIQHELMPHGHVYDIELPGGTRVDVKGAYRTFKPPSNNCSPYYQFQSRKTQVQYIDLYILVVVPTMDFFIMPEEEMGNKSIRLIWPGVHRVSKWAVWHNRFDLLR